MVGGGGGGGRGYETKSMNIRPQGMEYILLSMGNATATGSVNARDRQMDCTGNVTVRNGNSLSETTGLNLSNSS